MQSARVSEIYDAIAAGSHAAGGWAVKRLPEAGLQMAPLGVGRNGCCGRERAISGEMQMTHCDDEKALMEDAASAGAEVFESAGAKNIQIGADLAMPGIAIHETGTAGVDPKKFVLDRYSRAPDVKNVFGLDGACYRSPGCRNPAPALMARAVRTCGQPIKRFRKNAVRVSK
jgi:choline dehydrogenase-like flavoprotein